MALMICLTCRVRTPKHRSGRCPEHRREVERAREANPERRALKAERYNPLYRKERAIVARYVGLGRATCARCGEPIAADAPFDLDHLDDGRLHPSHPHCNRSARSNPERSQ